MSNSAFDMEKELQRQYPCRIEMHCHARPVSRCARIDSRELVRFYAGRGYHAITLTDHFQGPVYREQVYGPSVKSAQAYVEFCMNSFREAEDEGKKYGIKVYPCAEATFDTRGGEDFLLYGFTADDLVKATDLLGAESDMSRLYTLKNQRNLFIQAHPYRGNCPIPLPYIDGMEIVNSGASNSQNCLAMEYANTHGLKIVTAGSDFHGPLPHWDALTALRTRDLPEDQFELVEVLKSGDYLIEVCNHLIFP